MRRLLATVTATAALLAACTTAGPIDPDSPYDPVPEDSTLILHQAVPIPEGQARAFIQDGRIGESASPFQVHCQLETATVSDGRLTVQPDTFRITAVQRTDVHSVTASLPLQIAGIGIGIGIGSTDMDTGSSDVMLGWDLWLESEQQPGVRKLTCGGMRDAPYRALRPSINEIRRTLGPLAELNLARISHQESSVP